MRALLIFGFFHYLFLLNFNFSVLLYKKIIRYKLCLINVDYDYFSISPQMKQHALFHMRKSYKNNFAVTQKKTIKF